MEIDQPLIADPKDELVGMLNEQLGGIRRRVTEFKAQIDQLHKTVEQQQTRNADIAAELQNINHNLDTVPRSDIRDKFNEALEVRSRLLTMRSQLERFQASYDQLQQEQQLLASVLTKLQGVDLGSELGDDSKSENRATANIVRIVQAQEEERQRLARQMHDGPAQSLTNFILQTEICQRLFDRNPERAAEELGNLKTTASVTFQKVRDFIFDLRPMMLDDLGLVPTVRRYVASFKDKSDVAVELEITGEERRLENFREVLLFRGIQELLINARDYANANSMKIRLDMAPKRIRVLVEDNGRGFDAEATFASDELQLDTRQQGLVTLREKYELVDGTVTISSSENEGTTVRLELPSGE
jgi:two-component system sensor histidine kinase DegS